jgi:hypothetical protein
MIGYFPDAGLIFMLQQIVSSNLHLHLFSNNVSPGDSTTLAALTECAFTGYAKQTLTAASWVSLGVSSHIGALAYPTVTFSNTGGGSTVVYGWYITDVADAILVSVGLLDGSPVTIPATIGTVSFIPTIGDLDQN